MQEAIQSCLAQGNRSTFALLLKINEAIDADLLDENKEKPDYIITQLRELYIRYCRIVNDNKELKNKLEQTETDLQKNRAELQATQEELQAVVNSNAIIYIIYIII